MTEDEDTYHRIVNPGGREHTGGRRGREEIDAQFRGQRWVVDEDRIEAVNTDIALVTLGPSKNPLAWVGLP